MGYDPSRWVRLEYDGVPIYLRGDGPAWFVPNRAGDQMLTTCPAEGFPETDFAAARFLGRLPDLPPRPYPGRSEVLPAAKIRELWFHVTQRCNLKCRHCLFGSSPRETLELPASRIISLAREASAAGCRVFALTGGEPLVHRKFPEILDALADLPGARVVVLTNGMLLERVFDSRRWDLDRLHFQVSVDGLEERHDRLRGKGSFRHLTGQLKWLRSRGASFTLSMSVTRENLQDLAGLVDLAAAMGAGNVHFLWYFTRGRGEPEGFVPPEQIFERLMHAHARSESLGISIDNLEALETQVFAPMGTIHDGGAMAWESAAVGPDGRLYPSAALVGIDALATEIGTGLEAAWEESPVLKSIRTSTAASLASPFRFILGGGDPDHSWWYGGTFLGSDPYEPLYERLALYLIARRASLQSGDGPPRLRLKMGDVLKSCGAHGSVAFTHSNCLLAVAGKDSLTVVKEYYADAPGDARREILNPASYPERWMEHIPEEFRFRGYGCGSPVMEAGLLAGQTVLDLGCGSGVECFIASREVGPEGRVVGVDMLDSMLDLARRGAEAVSRRLGWSNLEFRKGFLERLPAADDTADVVVSNCVLNLSADKRKTFSEIHRVLKPGGRLVVSDVVAETEPDPAVRNDPGLRGECIAGALTERDLAGILDETGFESFRLVKRFPYRNVNGHPFFSLTYEARKPRADRETVRVIYRGPLAAAVTGRGTVLPAGTVVEIAAEEAEILGDQVFIIDENGVVRNIPEEGACGCALAPERRLGHPAVIRPESAVPAASPKRRAGCMVCGARLEYLETGAQARCEYCGREFLADALCAQGHYVCDRCHSEDALWVIEHLSRQSRETDLLALFSAIRRHPALPIHGPEHHSLVPAVILAAARNAGVTVTPEDLRAGIRRGSKVAGGSCGFMGVCGAAVGVGIAFGLLLKSNPVKPAERQQIQTAVQKVLLEIAAVKAARCCQRDSWIALKKASDLSLELIGTRLPADHLLRCRQQGQNPQCLATACPLNPRSARFRAAGNLA